MPFHPSPDGRADLAFRPARFRALLKDLPTGSDGLESLQLARMAFRVEQDESVAGIECACAAGDPRIKRLLLLQAIDAGRRSEMAVVDRANARSRLIEDVRI